MPDLDSESWSRMTAEATSIAMQTPDRLPDDDKLAQIQKVLRELEQYGHSLQEQIKARQHEWRIITATLLRELEDRLGFDASEMELRIGDLEKAEDLHEYRMQLGDFLHPDLSGSHDDTELHFRRTDLSTNNINAAGLRGGGSAVEHVRRIMDTNRRGHIAMIRLGCLDMISERFGLEAVEDCLMAVSAYLTAALRREDQIYHWSDSMLLAVLEDRINDKIVAAELGRITSQNKEITVNIGGRTVMLRIPLEYEITSVRALGTPEDLFKLTLHDVKQG